MKLFFKSIGYLILIGIVTILYAMFIEPDLLRVIHYDFPHSKIQAQPIKVVQFSDTHIGDFFTIEELQKVVDKINEQEADLVLFTGDLMDDASVYQGSIEEIGTVLSNIQSKFGNYAVFGNRDYGGGAERFYEELMESAGFHVLLNNQETHSS